MELEALRDLLCDLEHDLGKYLVLPINMLPADADLPMWQDALTRGLQETRRGPNATLGARQLWNAFLERAAAPLRERDLWNELERAVETALRWEGTPVTLDLRATITADLRAVAPAIRRVLRGL